MQLRKVSISILRNKKAILISFALLCAMVGLRYIAADTSDLYISDSRISTSSPNVTFTLFTWNQYLSRPTGSTSLPPGLFYIDMTKEVMSSNSESPIFPGAARGAAYTSIILDKGTRYGTIVRWKQRDKNLWVKTKHYPMKVHFGSDLSCSPDGKIVSFIDNKQQIWCMDSRSGKCEHTGTVGTLDLQEVTSPYYFVWNIACTNDKTVYVGIDGASDFTVYKFDSLGKRTALPGYDGVVTNQRGAWGYILKEDDNGIDITVQNLSSPKSGGYVLQYKVKRALGQKLNFLVHKKYSVRGLVNSDDGRWWFAHVICQESAVGMFAKGKPLARADVIWSAGQARPYLITAPNGKGVRTFQHLGNPLSLRAR